MATVRCSITGGYGGSSSVEGAGSVLRDAVGCQALLAALRIERAHFVGLSYSAAVVLQLAFAAPSLVQSVVLLEPPPVHIPSADEFRAANAQLLEARRVSGSAAALDEFATVVLGHDWRFTGAGASHSLAITHPAEIAGALVPFLKRHPIKDR